MSEFNEYTISQLYNGNRYFVSFENETVNVNDNLDGLNVPPSLCESSVCPNTNFTIPNFNPTQLFNFTTIYAKRIIANQPSGSVIRSGYDQVEIYYNIYLLTENVNAPLGIIETPLKKGKICPKPQECTNTGSDQCCWELVKTPNSPTINPQSLTTLTNPLSNSIVRTYIQNNSQQIKTKIYEEFKDLQSYYKSWKTLTNREKEDILLPKVNNLQQLLQQLPWDQVFEFFQILDSSFESSELLVDLKNYLFNLSETQYSWTSYNLGMNRGLGNVSMNVAMNVSQDPPTLEYVNPTDCSTNSTPTTYLCNWTINYANPMDANNIVIEPSQLLNFLEEWIQGIYKPFQ